MPVDRLTSALSSLPDNPAALDIALAGSAAGFRVWPVIGDGRGHTVPVAHGGGVAHGDWSGATCNVAEIERLFVTHSTAIPGFADQTLAGTRIRVWRGTNLETIPTFIFEMGR